MFSLCLFFLYLLLQCLEQVTVGFTTAAAMTIGSSQIKSLLGIKGSTNGFVQSWISVFTQIEETRLWDAVLGASTITVLLLLKVQFGHFFSEKEKNVFQKNSKISKKKSKMFSKKKTLFFFEMLFHLSIQLYLFISSLQNLKYKKSLRDIESQSVWKNECKKYLSLGRNAIVVIFGTLLAYILDTYDHNPFTLTGKTMKKYLDV